MDISFLTNYINPIILGICLLLGYVVKIALPKMPNRYIPLAALILGAALSVLINFPGITAEVILGGMVSGLASTGLYEMLRNLINKDNKKESTETDNSEDVK